MLYEFRIVCVFWSELRSTTVLNYPPRSVHCNVLVRSDYNVSQYIHMPDKGWHLSDFGGAFLHLNTGNGAMPLNPRPKRPSYVVFFVLYEFCVVWNFPHLIFSFVLYACCMMYCIALSFFNLLFSDFWDYLIFRFACCIRVLYKRVIRNSRCIWACCTCCFSVLYKHIVWGAR